MAINRDELGKFLPGSHANPSGRPKLLEEEIKAREHFRTAIAYLGTKTMAELEKIATDPNSTAVYAMQAKALQWFMKKGNPQFLKEMNDRTLGKQADVYIEQNTVNLDGEAKARMVKMIASSNFLKDPEVRKQIIDAEAVVSKDVSE